MPYDPRCPLEWKNISKRLKATCISLLGHKRSVIPRAKLHTRPLGTKEASEARAGGPWAQLGTGQTSQAPKAIPLIWNWQQLKQDLYHQETKHHAGAKA